jgi:hypothetical protein
MKDFVIFELSLPVEEADELREYAAYCHLPQREEHGAFSVLDWRLVRQSLPAGAKPVAVVDLPNALFISGEYFTADEIKEFADKL